MTDSTATLAARITRPLALPATLPDDLRLAGRQVAYMQRAFWRSRGAAFFLFALPLAFIVLFSAAHAGGTLPGQDLPYDDYLLPGLVAYGLVMATFANVALGLVMARDEGILKRVRTTPLPVWAFVAGRIGSALVTAVLLTAVSVGVGELAFSTDLRVETLPGLLLTLAVAAICLSALGVAALRIMGSGDTARVLVNVIVLPLTFISGIWSPPGDMPAWLDDVAKVFPLEHVAAGLRQAFDPHVAAPGVSWSDLAVLAVWAVAGILLSRGVLRPGRE